MSHSFGAVKFDDGLVLYCEYNGTVDVMQPKLYDTMQEVSDHWREQYAWPTCKCGNSEKVRICTSYGNGFSWYGRACKQCKIITDFYEPDYDSETAGIPNWASKLKF